MNIKVSIIIPIYNVEQFLPKCIDSILNQTLKETEIILINDGSTDKSGDIANEYARRYDKIRVLHLKNGGPSIARNKGIELASGEFISFVDSDDYIDDNMLEVMYNKGKLLDVDVVMCGYKKVYENKVISENKLKILCDKEIKHEEIIDLIINANKTKFYWFACRNIYKKSLLDNYNIRFDENINMGEDTLFNLNAFYNSKSIVALKDCFYNYRDNPNSLTQTKYKMNLNTVMIKHYEEKNNFYKSNNIYELAERDIREHICFSVLPMLFSNAFNSPNHNKTKLFREILKIPIIVDALDNTKILKVNASRGNKIIAILAKMKLIILLKCVYELINKYKNNKHGD